MYVLKSDMESSFPVDAVQANLAIIKNPDIRKTLLYGSPATGKKYLI